MRRGIEAEATGYVKLLGRIATVLGRPEGRYASPARERAAQDPSRRRQAWSRRPRPRGEDHRPRASRRGNGGDLHRAAPDPGADRRDRDPGGRRCDRALDPLGRPHDPRPAGDQPAARAGRRRRRDHGRGHDPGRRRRGAQGARRRRGVHPGRAHGRDRRVHRGRRRAASLSAPDAPRPTD